MISFLKKNGVWIGFLLLVVLVSIATEGSFLTARNLTNLLRQASINGILAAGMTIIILTGGIDLSIGSVVALCGIVIGVTQVNMGWANLGVGGAFASAGLAVLAGTLLGVVNGALISGLRIAPFVISLGMMVIARGLALIFSGGASLAPMSSDFSPVANASLPMIPTAIVIALICGGFVLFVVRSRKEGWGDALFPLLTFALFSYAFLFYQGFPILGLFLLAVMGTIGFVLTNTTFGRSIYALGSNERAAFWAGVPVRKVTFFAYVIMGALAGLAGVLLTARLNGSDPNAGQLFELDAIAAVVIGGTSLKGGQGGVLGTFVGALTIATLNNGMDLLGVPSFYQMVLKGVIIVLAVGLDRGQRTEA